MINYGADICSEAVSMAGISDHDGLSEKLKNLAAEIETGILNMQQGSTEEKQQCIDAMRREAQRMRSPDAVYVHLLFRKYANATNETVASLRESSMFYNDGAVGFIFEPKDEKRLVGLKALKTNIFWLRMVSAVLAFISYVVMSTARYITEDEFHPSDFFEVQAKRVDIVQCVMLTILYSAASCYYAASCSAVFPFS